MSRVTAAGLLACVCAAAAVTMAGKVAAGEHAVAASNASRAHFETYLDRLMRAESNGRDNAANPRSTALGPFQFIKSTFIELARRHFRELADLEEEQLLALRTDRAVARRAAAIYSMESLAILTNKGLNPTFGDLRLAYLVGPYAAARILQADPQTPAAEILGASVVRANPFMRGMSASQLIARCARDVGEHRPSVAAAETSPEPRSRPVASQAVPRVSPRPEAKTEVANSCNRKLASCRRWLALQVNKERVARQAAAKAAKAASRRAARPGA